MSNYRGIDNSFRMQMRPKGRVPFKHGGEQMQPAGRGRFMQGMQMPTQQSSSYTSSVGYHTPPRSNQYPPEYVGYPQQVAVSTPTWNQSIPLTVSDSYPHSYQQQQSAYNPETTHMMTVPNNAYINPIQNQNDFDPVANVCFCSKCGFVNTLAFVQLRNARDQIKNLEELLAEKERQLAELQHVNANYEDPSQTTVHQSSLSVDAQPFQMASAPPHETHQVAHVATNNVSNNPNSHTWPGSYASTPVVSASAATSDRYDDEAAADNDWDNTPDGPPPQAPSEELSPGKEVEPSSADGEDRDQAQQDAQIMSSSGPFDVSGNHQEESNHRESEQISIPPDDECMSQKEERGVNEASKSRPREQRPRHNNKGRGARNDRHDNREDSRGSYNRRGSGGSNKGYRPSSPTDKLSKNTADSRDSSHSRTKSGPEHSDKIENSLVEEPEKNFEPAERNNSEKHWDTPRRHSQDKHLDTPGDRGFNNRQGGRRDSRNRSDETNWRNPETAKHDDSRRDRDDSRRDRDDRNDNRRDRDDRNVNYSRPGYRSNESFKKGSPTFKVVSETEGDLFKAPAEFSLAHCVAEDLRMGSGIAVGFRQQFKCVEELLDQRKRVGEVAFLEDKKRYIFYLVTKYFSHGKPTWEHFCASITELKNLCVQHEVKNLAMPRLGCGLDRLEWRRVKQLIENTFADSGVAITVYNFQQNDDESSTPKPKSSFFIVHQKKDLVDINPETGLIFLCSEDSAPNRTVDSLDKKHNIMLEYRSAKKVVGEVINIQKGKEYLYGLVVKKSEKDVLSYANLSKCLRKLRNSNSKERYGFFGLEAFRDDKDTGTMEKVVSIFRNLFGGVQYKMELYICWPNELQNDHHWDEPTTPTASSK